MAHGTENKKLKKGSYPLVKSCYLKSSHPSQQSWPQSLVGLGVLSHFTNFMGFLKIVHSLALVLSISEAVQSAGVVEEAAEKVRK